MINKTTTQANTMFNKWTLTVAVAGSAFGALPAFASTDAVSADVNTAANALDVYTQMGQGTIDQYARVGGVWTSTQLSGVPAVSNNSSIASYVNTIYNGNEVFYLTPNTQGSADIEQLWGTTLSPTDLTRATGGKAAASGSGLVGFIDSFAGNGGTDNVFYVGVDDHVHLLTWSPNAPWSSEDVTVLPSPAAPPVDGTGLSGHLETACANQSEEVFYVASDLHVHELWRWSTPTKFDGWHHTDVSLAAGAPLAVVGTALVSFGDSFASTDDVFYLGAGGHIEELKFSCSHSTWSSTDITATYSAPVAISGSALAGHVNNLNSASPSEELYYVGTNDHVYELWAWSLSTHFDGWHPSDVSGSIGVPAAIAGSPLAVDVSSGQDEVYYIDATNRLSLLAFGSSWTQSYP